MKSEIKGIRLAGPRERRSDSCSARTLEFFIRPAFAKQSARGESPSILVMDLKELVMLAFRVSILSTVFGFGLRATSRDLLYLGRRPGLLLRSVIAVFVIMPIVAVVLARVFDFRRTVEITLVAIAVSPSRRSCRCKGQAGGQTSNALGLMAILALLSIVVVPLSVEVLGRLLGGRSRWPRLLWHASS